MNNAFRRTVESWLRPLVFLLSLVAISPFTPSVAAEQDGKKNTFDVKEHYTKYEYRIPMRDGVKLFTAVFVPKDASTAYPFLMERTPYGIGPYGSDEYLKGERSAQSFLKSGYIFVMQDVRGRLLSEGTFVEETPHRDQKREPRDVDESTDTYDTVEWLLHHVANNNGRVGIWGISYPGFFTLAGIIDSHPAIKAASPQAPMADEFLGDDCYHGGAFMLAANFGFYTGFKSQNQPSRPPRSAVEFDYGTEDAYEFFLKLGPISNAAPLLDRKDSYWNDILAHPTYDAFWQQRAIWQHAKNIHCAVLTVGGWFDAEDLMGPLRTYHAIEENNPGISNSIVMGPWVHGGWDSHAGRRLGSVDFAADTAIFYSEKIFFPFFEQHLKDKADAKLPEAYVFETGTNVWRQYPSWPAPGVTSRTLYFHANGELSFDAPSKTTSTDHDAYISDPAKPVPFIGYTAPGVPQEYMVADQRFAATRPDVLVYSTETLEEDVTLAGPVSPKLFVATTGTDADWIVKLIDVYPADRSTPVEVATEKKIDDVPPPSITLAGYQQLVRGEPFRGKFRRSLERPEPFVPGKIEAVNFTMPDVNHTFRRGHKIMVQVQSTWFPLVDRNPQTFVNIPTARPEDFRVATQSVFRTAEHPSGIQVLVLPNSATPAAAAK